MFCLAVICSWYDEHGRTYFLIGGLEELVRVFGLCLCEHWTYTIIWPMKICGEFGCGSGMCETALPRDSLLFAAVGW